MRLRSAWRALVLLAVVLDVPAARGVVGRLTRAPRVEQWRVDEVPVEVVRPGGPGPWPTWVFVNGAHPERREEPVVRRLTRGLARAGYLVVVPDLPGLGDGAITARTLDATVAVARAAADRSDVARGRVALIGASTGAALALLAAADPSLVQRVTVVAAVAPYADLERVLCLATTCGYDEGGSFATYEVTDLQRHIVATSLVATLTHETERDELLAALERARSAGTDPVQALARAARSSAEAAAIVDLLRNDDPGRFGGLYRALPQNLRELVDALSPIHAAPRVQAPVEIVVPPADVYFPLGEARDLAAALPRARLTVTRTLDHTRPQLTTARIRDGVSFLRFVVRGLAAAA